MRPEIARRHCGGRKTYTGRGGKLLYRAIKADKNGVCPIFYGPPGVGKTTLARVIANTTSADFRQVNATVAGKKDMEMVVEAAKSNLGQQNKRTILFIDEIHRFNKGQQDYLLPFVEDGTLILIGATTENPYFEVNGALLSRSRIFELKPLSTDNIRTLIDKALTDPDKGLGKQRADITDEGKTFLAERTGGDAREALNALELAVLTTDRSADGLIHLNTEVLAECIQKKVLRYDKEGENHYDAISAFIESMKHSDPDATLYYLARMVEAGEDVKYIARRIMMCASVDVGSGGLTGAGGGHQCQSGGGAHRAARVQIHTGPCGGVCGVLAQVGHGEQGLRAGGGGGAAVGPHRDSADTER
jgi:putative ATPase